VSKILYLSV